jgi:predicted dithiol-disulfide oxidoreductase (DUF899 family)
MTKHRIGTNEEYQQARDELLAMEKELTRRNDELAEKRRALPWVPVEKEYTFDTSDGTKSLAQLFDGRSQLVVYHFMFGPAYEAGCPTCSSIGDSIDGLAPHLNARDVTMVCASAAPLEKLQAYEARMGWSFEWVSTHDSDFNADYGFTVSEGQARSWVGPEPSPLITKVSAMCGTDPVRYMTQRPGLTAFALSDGVVHHTYSTTARGLEVVMGYYGLLDRAPLGRNEGDPREFWFQRHDEYGRAPAGSR